jgi:hypothetical protein
MGPNNKDAEQNYYDTQQRLKLIQKYASEHNMEVEEIWECEVRQMLKEDKYMKQFFAEIPDKGPIDPRAAYFGGKNNNKCKFNVHFRKDCPLLFVCRSQ